MSEKKIGKYTFKRKFNKFLQGRKGGVRISLDSAYLNGKKLSGMLEDVKFKITLCDDNTIDFEEVGTNKTTPEMIQRFINDIEESDVTGFMNKFVLYGFEFEDENGGKVYLEVEETKPIDKLFSIFDEEKINTEISEKASSILDSLFSDEEDYESEEEEENYEENTTQETKQKDTDKDENLSFAEQMIMDSFNSMNSEKIQELQDRIDKKESELNKYEYTIKSTQTSLNSCKEEIRLLNSRLDKMKPKADPNGIVFYVSPENKTGLEPDETTKDIVSKVSAILKLNEHAVLDMITKGYYTIKFCDKTQIQNPSDYQMKKETMELILKLKSEGSITLVSDNEFEFRGELDWHKIVDKLIRMGFEQDSEWDKICGSPSYSSSSSSLNDTYDDNYDNDDILEAREEFEEINGYECGDTFIFAMINDQDQLTPSNISIAIQPKSYWDNTGYLYDGHTEPLIGNLSGFGEDSESMFSHNTLINPVDIINELVRKGIDFDPTFQDFMERNEPSPFKVNNQKIEEYMKQRHPNSIV